MRQQQRELNSRVVECVVATNGQIDDYGQRSAIGMARSFLEERKPVPIGTNSLDRYPRRDVLAMELADILRDVTKEDGIEALSAAREVVNAPFQRKRFVGSKGAGVLNKPGPRKKKE